MRNYIALAAPFFFIFIALEMWLARRRRTPTYRFNDVLVNVANGTGQQLVAVFVTAGLIAIYVGVQRRLGIFHMSVSSPWTWLFSFIAVDFTYYWWHRLSHQVNFLWAAHVVHHSSEDFNLAVALRQGIGTIFTNFLFALALAIVGVPPAVYIALESFSLLYQFWIHTEHIGHLGWYERIFNTPAQHRVHHAVNPRYLDKNYGGTLSIWDRIFGTYEEEKEAPVFGLVHPLGSFNPLWSQVHYWVEVWNMAKAAPRGRDKFLAWVKGPTWRPEGLPPVGDAPDVTPQSRRKYEPPLGEAMRGYLWFQIVATMSITFFVLLFQNEWPRDWVTCGAVIAALSMIAWGGLLEKKSWAIPLELFRLLFCAFAASYLFAASLSVAVLALLLAIALLPQLFLLWSARTVAGRESVRVPAS